MSEYRWWVIKGQTSSFHVQPSARVKTDTPCFIIYYVHCPWRQGGEVLAEIRALRCWLWRSVMNDDVPDKCVAFRKGPAYCRQPLTLIRARAKTVPDDGSRRMWLTGRGYLGTFWTSTILRWGCKDLCKKRVFSVSTRSVGQRKRFLSPSSFYSFSPFSSNAWVLLTL